MTVMLFTRLDHSANIRTLVRLPNVCLATVMALPNDTVPTPTHTHTHTQVPCLLVKYNQAVGKQQQVPT